MSSQEHLIRFLPRRRGVIMLVLMAITLLLGAACSGGPAAPTTGPVAGTSASAPSGAIGAMAAPSGEPIRIVAVENFYGDVAQQIGGERVSVVSILSDPLADPHDYESNAEDAKAVANAHVVIKNGLGYDFFVDKLLAASPRPNRIVVDVRLLAERQDGDNPHVWYEPQTMQKLARHLTSVLTQLAPASRDYFEHRLASTEAAQKPVDEAIRAIRSKHSGAKILATEAIFDYMAEALGLTVVAKEGAFQRAVEDGNDPPASAVAEFRQQLSSGTIKVLVYNNQAVTPLTDQMRELARQHNVAVVAITETLPAGKSYQQWMLDELRSIEQALGG